MEQVTWVVHHPTRSIHRLAQPHLPGHVGRMTMAEVTVVARCSALDLEGRFPDYTPCGLCCPGTASAAKRAAKREVVEGSPVLMGQGGRRVAL